MEQLKRNAIGNQIRRIRDSRKISQQHLSSLCSRKGYEITRSTLAKIEAGIRAVSDIELFVIAKALGLRMEELFSPKFEKSLRQNKIVPFRTRTDVSAKE